MHVILKISFNHVNFCHKLIGHALHEFSMQNYLHFLVMKFLFLYNQLLRQMILIDKESLSSSLDLISDLSIDFLSAFKISELSATTVNVH